MNAEYTRPESAHQMADLRQPLGVLARLLGRQAARDQLSAGCPTSDGNPDFSDPQPVVQSSTTERKRRRP